MDITIKLTEQEEKALEIICSSPAGVRQERLQQSLEATPEEMLEVLTDLRKKGFKFDVMPSVRLSTSYPHHESLMAKFKQV